MDNQEYEIPWDFAEGQEVLDALSSDDRETVDAAIRGLAKNPWPKQFSAKPQGEKAVKITVPIRDDEITVLYDVDVYKATIDIGKIKPRGTFIEGR